MHILLLTFMYQQTRLACLRSSSAMIYILEMQITLTLVVLHHNMRRESLVLDHSLLELCAEETQESCFDIASVSRQL